MIVPEPPRLLASLEGIDACEWDALAGGNPTLSYAFLDSLHRSGSASTRTGWHPQFASLWDGKRLAAAAPLYVKSHSYGEYVFDWGWADAYERHGIAYYPKLVCAVPFTPATGPRLLATGPGPRERLARWMLELARETEVSSLHILFPAPEDATALRAMGMLERSGVQFHWRNAGYRDFDDFLGALSHDKRKKIRQERKTYRAHRSAPYLTRAFFGLIAERMPENVLLVMARREGRPIAAAMDLFGAGALYGRYWGSVEHVPGLHFEACYYQAIEFCIERGIALFEGGAQGEHKHARGFLPEPTRSFHWLAHPAFNRAIDEFLSQEGVHIAAYVDELNERTPFRK